MRYGQSIRGRGIRNRFTAPQRGSAEFVKSPALRITNSGACVGSLVVIGNAHYQSTSRCAVHSMPRLSDPPPRETTPHQHGNPAVEAAPAYMPSQSATGASGRHAPESRPYSMNESHGPVSCRSKRKVDSPVRSRVPDCVGQYKDNMPCRRPV
jgi:hypothetical protein